MVDSTKPGGEAVWLEVERPYDGWVELGVSPLLVVRGSAGSLGEGYLDLVILLDSSTSTAHASGVDVNGDGHTGGIGWKYRRDWRSYLAAPGASSDREDSVFSASLEAVRRLVGRLDARRTRVAVVTFRDQATIRSGIENTRIEFSRNMDSLSNERPSGRTDMGRAIRIALRAFFGTSVSKVDPREGVKRVIVLLSDGQPTVPDPPERAAENALEAALEAHRQGVQIYTIGLGIPDEESEVLKEISQLTGAAHAALDQPAEILRVLPALDIRGLADVEIRNLTSGKDARAVRVWADGTYDGYVRLLDGKNQLEITAHARGRTIQHKRWVYFRKRPPLTARDRREENRRLRELRDILRTRRVLVEVEHEIEAAKQRREGASKGVAIEVEP